MALHFDVPAAPVLRDCLPLFWYSWLGKVNIMGKEPIRIGDLLFTTKKAAKEYFRTMLAGYQNGQTVEDINDGHLRDLIERHPEATSKIGCGVKRFFKDRTDKPTSCFWLEREDGSRTDFSYISCVDAKSKSLYQEFAEACRMAVEEDLRAAKTEHFREHADSDGKVLCEITGERVAIYESHLDHKKPMTFQVIVRTFVKAKKITVRPEMLSVPRDAQFSTVFVDDELRREFREYHRSVADLRIVAAKENLCLGGAERITKSRNPVRIP